MTFVAFVESPWIWLVAGVVAVIIVLDAWDIIDVGGFIRRATRGGRGDGGGVDSSDGGGDGGGE